MFGASMDFPAKTYPSCRSHGHRQRRLSFCSELSSARPWTLAALTDQLAVKDDQIASLGRALEAAQETAKAAQALHAANVQERALESSEQKERRRWRWPWDRQDG